MPSRPHRSSAALASPWPLAACLAVIGSNTFALSAIAPAIAALFGIQSPGVMVAAACQGLATAVSALLLPQWIDRLGPFRCLHLAIRVFALAMLLDASAPSVPLLAAAHLLAGAAIGVAVPACYAGALAVAPDGQDSRTIGLALGGWTFSLVAGVGIATALADLVHWRAVYVAIALASAATILVLGRANAPVVHACAPSGGPVEALRIAGLRPLLLACAAAMAAFYGLYSYLGDYLHRGLGEPLMVNGLATLMYGVGFGVATFVDGLVDRVGPSRLGATVFLLGAAMYLAIALLAVHLWAVLAGFALLGAVNHLQVNVLVTRMTATDPARKGAILGLNTAITYVGSTIGTATFGPIYSGCGFRVTAAVSAALMLFAAYFAARRVDATAPMDRDHFQSRKENAR